MTTLETIDREFDDSLEKLERELREELDREVRSEEVYRLDKSQDPDTQLFGRLVLKNLGTLNKLYLPDGVDPQASIFED